MFHSSALSEKFEKLASTGKNLQQRLDEVSSDIKMLEDKLSEIAGGFPATIPLGKHEDLNEAEKSRLKKLGWPAKTWVSESLHWQRDLSSQKFRIIYQRVHELDPVSAGEWSQYDVEVAPEARPLIETPVEIRLRAYQKLPDLVDKLSELAE